ncbi:MAG TPA: S-adenosylmethionine:tRNA ribosyltransferase-isomerase, partial [Thermoanaerobaculia bacterium]|nr:S-adenosylmethionine:tRNA ribosyltransferase-isomerase [Thermoanaerobaculia bacterium]
MLRTDFSYHLPPELIAQEPRPRGESRMMVVERGGDAEVPSHRVISEFPSLLEPGDIVVLNDTRVFPARLFARTRGNQTRRTEVLLTRRIGASKWESWCRPAKRLKVGDTLEFSDTLSASVEHKQDEGTVVIDMNVQGEAELWREIEAAGLPPLPPYIRREVPQPGDRERYQTIYASRTGAIAAPTAGLHFTHEILDAIRARGAQIVTLTLHVGLGTFKPVKADDVRDHRMESEWYEISEEAS